MEVATAIRVFKTMKERIKVDDNSWSIGYRTALDHVIMILEDKRIE